MAQEVESGERVVVGVNRFRSEGEVPYEPLRVDPAIEETQARRPAGLRAARDGAEVRRRLDAMRRLAEKEGARAERDEVSAGDHNLLYPLKEALRARATVGEVCGVLRDVWGTDVPADDYLELRSVRIWDT